MFLSLLNFYLIPSEQEWFLRDLGIVHLRFNLNDTTNFTNRKSVAHHSVARLICLQWIVCCTSPLTRASLLLQPLWRRYGQPSHWLKNRITSGRRDMTAECLIFELLTSVCLFLIVAQLLTWSPQLLSSPFSDAQYELVVLQVNPSISFQRGVALPSTMLTTTSYLGRTTSLGMTGRCASRLEPWILRFFLLLLSMQTPVHSH